ncbi:hypothetical protein D9M71_136510 [compost metagenome]
MYQDIATITVSAERLGEAEAVDNEKVAISLEEMTEGVLKVHFTGKLAAPQEPTHVCVTLSGGLSYYGPIARGEANPDGGWMTFECDMPHPSKLS